MLLYWILEVRYKRALKEGARRKGEVVTVHVPH